MKNPDPDPYPVPQIYGSRSGRPKTYGSGSGTLIKSLSFVFKCMVAVPKSTWYPLRNLVNFWYDLFFRSPEDVKMMRAKVKTGKIVAPLAASSPNSPGPVAEKGGLPNARSPKVAAASVSPRGRRLSRSSEHSGDFLAIFPPLSPVQIDVGLIFFLILTFKKVHVLSSLPYVSSCSSNGF